MITTDELFKKYPCLKNVYYATESVFAPTMIIVFKDDTEIRHQVQGIYSLEDVINEYVNEYIIKERYLKIKKIRNL